MDNEDIAGKVSKEEEERKKIDRFAKLAHLSEEEKQELIKFKESIKYQNIEFHKLSFDDQLKKFTSVGIPNDVALQLTDLARKGRLNVAMFFYKSTMMEIQAAVVSESFAYYNPVKNLSRSLYSSISMNVLLNKLDEILGVVKMGDDGNLVSIGFQEEPLAMLPNKWKELSAVAS